MVIAAPLFEWVKLSLHVRFGSIPLKKSPAQRGVVCRNRRLRHAAALSYLSAFWQSLRDGPQSLTHKQIEPLAGDVYRSIALPLEEEPGPEETWAKLLEICEAALAGKVGVGRLYIGARPQHLINASLEKWFGETVDNVLSTRAIV